MRKIHIKFLVGKQLEQSGGCWKDYMKVDLMEEGRS
jgi:hypothetical protein